MNSTPKQRMLMPHNRWDDTLPIYYLDVDNPAEVVTMMDELTARVKQSGFLWTTVRDCLTRCGVEFDNKFTNSNWRYDIRHNRTPLTAYDMWSLTLLGVIFGRRVVWVKKVRDVKVTILYSDPPFDDMIYDAQTCAWGDSEDDGEDFRRIASRRLTDAVKMWLKHKQQQ